MKLFAVMTCTSLLVAGSAFAADAAAPAPSAASSIKASCTKDANDQGLKGKARKAAIHKCIKAAKAS